MPVIGGESSAGRIFREVAAQGFTGSRVLVTVFVAELRRQATAGEQAAPTAPEAKALRARAQEMRARAARLN